MRGYATVGLVSLALAACAAQTVSELPTGFYGTYQDNDVGAINQSSWAWASPGRTAGNPLEAIKAVIAIDWLTDELNVNPRWIEISPLAKQQMRMARVDVRRVLGIAVDAPSTVVVPALVRVTHSLQAGARPDDIDALRHPPFSLPPRQTIEALTHLPYIGSANVATSEVASETR